MTIKTKLSYLLLALIFILALILRLYRLNLNSPPLYSDEVSHYFYYQWLKLPNLSLFKRLAYSIFSATWIVGLNPLGVRLFSALNGSLTILIGFFFARSVCKSSGDNLYLRIALVFAALCAILPWNFAISRLGHTHITLVVFLTLLHLTIYLQAKNLAGQIISFVPFLIGCYFYPSLIIISPFILFLPVKDFFGSSHISKKYSLIFLGAFLFLVSFILIKNYKILDHKSRGQDLVIWGDVNVTAVSNLYRGLARLSNPSIFSFNQDTEKIANRLVFNYPLSVLSVLTQNYLSFFSPDFLFFKGDRVLRHSTGMVGNFYPILLPFMVFGAFIFFKNQSLRNRLLFATWILASPLPAAITKDGNTYLLRVITLMPFLTYFAALGLVSFSTVLKGRLAKAAYFLAITAILVFSAYRYFFGYFHVYPALSADSFEYGFQQLASFQIQNPGKMLVIWEDKYPVNYFCFWQRLPLTICQTESTSTRVFVNQSRVDLGLPSVLFSLPATSEDLDKIVKLYKPKYIAIPGKYQKLSLLNPHSYKLLQNINNPDQTTAFSLFSVNPSLLL